MSDHRQGPGRDGKGQDGPASQQTTTPDPLEVLDECLASLADDDPRQKILYKLRHLLLQQGVSQELHAAELTKLKTALEKVTAPANRIGTLLDLPDPGLARVIVGGSEYYTNIDPRVAQDTLTIGAQVLVNEAFAVIRVLGFDRNGPVVSLSEVLPDGRLLIRQEPGQQTTILLRSAELASIELKPGDWVRLDPSHRMAIERMEDPRGKKHVLDEVPTITWEQIGGQQQAIDAIRKALEYPIQHRDTFAKFKFSPPKGFLLYGPPGCGKTLLGQATAASLARLTGQKTSSFMHVKGPEVLNMWLGESERIVRDLFAQARQRRKEGALPVLFIDEAESILGTRRAQRSFNISNTLVPMFCAEMDGIEPLHDVVIILASNRPDLIDPAVLRPGRIDRKIKVQRPGKEQAQEILKIYLSSEIPLAGIGLDAASHDQAGTAAQLVAATTDALYARQDDTRMLMIRLRNGQRETLYRGDLVSGAILASIVQRAKERAIERTIAAASTSTPSGLTKEDLVRSIDDEFREGDILPPDDSAEEWLKLLDFHPEQVVGVSSYRRGRASQERTISQVI